jgi:transposase
MKLVEQHTIKKSDVRFEELDKICFLSKNLYNAGLYAVRQHYFDNKKFLNYPSLSKLFVKEKNVDYYALPTKVSQQTLKMVEQNFKSFFGLLKTKKKSDKINIPSYLDKSGRFSAYYTIQAISKTELKKGIVKLSGTDIRIKTDKEKSDKVTDIIKTVDDILEYNKIERSEFDKKYECLEPYEKAHKILVLLCISLNEDWIPNWDDSDEYKYYPWFEMGSSGFRSDDYDCWHTGTYPGSRLCFKSAGEQFKDVYEQYMVIK